MCSKCVLMHSCIATCDITHVLLIYQILYIILLTQHHSNLDAKTVNIWLHSQEDSTLWGLCIIMYLGLKWPYKPKTLVCIYTISVHVMNVLYVHVTSLGLNTSVYIIPVKYWPPLGKK